MVQPHCHSAQPRAQCARLITAGSEAHFHKHVGLISQNHHNQLNSNSTSDTFVMHARIVMHATQHARNTFSTSYTRTHSIHPFVSHCVVAGPLSPFAM